MADFYKIGVCFLSLLDLTNENGAITHKMAPILSARDGSTIGHMHIRMKLALPVTELFELYLKENPSERSRVERLRLTDRNMAIDAAERAKQQNYLEVVIVRCTKLRTRNGDAPKAYVGYKLFGYENVVTDVAEEGTDPTFDSEQACQQINGQF